ncbi:MULTISPECIES: hypothetical protein [unclassified Rhizobium]|uniref:hypothetical protein n=1 Tax=unclassified Rhizobium TaxID=2613769 RepID=UPI000AEE97A4|nr:MULTISPECIES: hypothetical protein [unclassified Rhizobium]
MRMLTTVLSAVAITLVIATAASALPCADGIADVCVAGRSVESPWGAWWAAVLR